MSKYYKNSSRKSQSPLHQAPFFKSNFNPITNDHTMDHRDKNHKHNLHFYSTSLKPANNIMNKTDLLRGIKSTFLRSEDFSFKKGKFGKALEKKHLKSSNKKSIKTIKVGRSKSRIDGKMKLCINAICNQDDNSKIYDKEKYRKSKKSVKKMNSHRSILDRV